MAWKRLDSVVSGVLSRIDTGETGVAAPVVSRKRAESTKLPAKSREAGSTPVSPSANKGHANREMIIAPTNGSPRPAVVISLVVDNSGRTVEGRKLYGPAFRRNARGDRLRETKLRLVSG